MLVIMLFACRTIPISLEKNHSPAESEKFYFADPEKMDFLHQPCVCSNRRCQVRLLEFFPLVITNPQTKIDFNDQTDYLNFRQRDILITKETESPEGISTLSMICKSVDSFGRIDLSINQIIYELRPPDKKETDEIKKFITQGLKSSKQINDKQSINFMKKRL